MAPTTNGRLLFSSYPKDYPVPGETTVYDASETIDLDSVKLDGGVLFKLLYLSVDPYLRGRMNPPNPGSYRAGFEIGKPLESHTVVRVLRSEHPDFKAGEAVYGVLPWQQYFVRAKDRLSNLAVLHNKDNISLSAYISAAGMPGRTAYHGWREYSRAKKSETVFVSTGAGAVGTVVIQLAKAAGLKVIGSAGSAEKVQRMKDIGADVAFNYKEQKTADLLKEHGPIDIFWDHVGGETLEAALENAADGARFIECGMISQYNNPNKVGIRNLFLVIARGITLSGFIVSSLEPKYGQDFLRELPAKIASGEIKNFEERTIGLEKAGDVILDVQKGRNIAKAVVVVTEE